MRCHGGSRDASHTLLYKYQTLYRKNTRLKEVAQSDATPYNLLKDYYYINLIKLLPHQVEATAEGFYQTICCAFFGGNLRAQQTKTVEEEWLHLIYLSNSDMTHKAPQ